MRNASALSRFVAMMIATGVVLGGCGQTSHSPAPDAGSSNAGSSEAGTVGMPLTGGGAGAAVGAGMPVAAGSAAKTRIGSTIDPAAVYKVFFCGRGGTGFVASNGRTGNYIDALQRGDWKLPYGTPPLVVIEG